GRCCRSPWCRRAPAGWPARARRASSSSRGTAPRDRRRSGRSDRSSRASRSPRRRPSATARGAAPTRGSAARSGCRSGSDAWPCGVIHRVDARREAVAAARILGLGPGELTFLGYPDFGTFEIWTEHWGEKPPLRSKLTRVTAVPYASAFRPGAPYKGEEILRDLSTLVRDFRPTKV